MESKPFCSIIILNYYGEDVISKAVDHLIKLNYPPDRLEIIIVDNDSKDQSRKIIKTLNSRYNNVRSIFLRKNLGFSGGNNVGIRAAKGEYIILLNNDCFVHKDWLIKMVKQAEVDKNIFAVNPKVLLYPRFSFIKIYSDDLVTFDECHLVKSNLLRFTKNKKIPLKIEKENSEIRIEVSYDPDLDSEIEIDTFVSQEFEKENANLVDITLSKKTQRYASLYKVKKAGGRDFYKINVDIKKLETLNEGFDKIQNAGVIVFQDGYGRDIGSVVKYQNEDFEADLGQYNKEREIYATNAAASLFRKSVLEKIGLLDDYFFVYYEDVDLSERARIYGYKNVYAPNSIVRHLHAFSSKEGSPFFTYNAAKGRFLHMAYNFPFLVFLYHFFGFMFGFKRIIKTLKTMVLFLLRKLQIIKLSESAAESKDLQAKRLKISVYVKLLFYFISLLPILVFRRFRKYGFNKFDRIGQNYRSILEGTWYFDNR